jgi:arylsulfatase A-like enzyme
VVDLASAPGELVGGADRDRFRTRVRGQAGIAATAVENAPNRPLAFPLSLGSDAAFEFRPNPLGGACVFEVSVRRAGGSNVALLRREVEPRPAALPPSVGDNLLDAERVDLQSYDHRSIELILSANGKRCARAQWVSATVTYRQPIAAAARTDRPNVILIGADTLRADAVGPWRRSPSVTPALDRLAETSDVFLNAYASSNNTNPSFVSLMTGLYAKDHGVFDLSTSLPDGAVTLAEILSDAGYQTLAVVSVQHLAESSGLRQGFDRFVGADGQFFAETATNFAMGQIGAATEPFFSWLHLFDPHVPESPPAPYHLGYRAAAPYGLQGVERWVPFRDPGPRSFMASARAGLLGHPDLYSGEVSYLDRQVDRLLHFLDSRGLLERSIVVFVADHGENLGEHGFSFDHAGLWDATVHVPLLIHWPGQTRGRSIGALVQHLDLFPTLLAATGLESRAGVEEGLDLRQLDERDRGRPAVFAHYAEDLGEMVRTARFKYYRQRLPTFVPVGRYFYDLERDPAELHNLAGTGRPEEKELERLLDRWRQSSRSGPSPVPRELTSKARRQLEALGYVE